ncbi:MAG: dTMP kinase [Candidatus Heimdallarchaeota archaeon]
MCARSTGLLIVFEGIDGSGKTTQIERVAAHLRTYHSMKVKVTHEPNHNSPYYQMIKEKVKRHRNQTLPEEELELYLKDRKWDLEHNILPALARGEIVLVDRYYLSNAAYQGALAAFSPLNILERNVFARKPDLWIILDVSVEVGQSRIVHRDKKQNEDMLEFADFQKLVRKNYFQLAKMGQIGRVEWIDTETLTEEELTQKIIQVILSLVDK